MSNKASLKNSRTLQLAALSPVLTAMLVVLQEQIPLLREELGTASLIAVSMIVSGALAYIRLTHDEKSKTIDRTGGAE